jgi:hypothetical protein
MFSTFGRYAWIPYFLIAFSMAFRLQNLIVFMQQYTGNFDPSTESLVVYGSLMLAIIYSGMCGFQAMEAFFGNQIVYNLY